MFTDMCIKIVLEKARPSLLSCLSQLKMSNSSQDHNLKCFLAQTLQHQTFSKVDSQG